MWLLGISQFFICGVTMVMYINVNGWIQNASGDGEVKWCLVLSTDGGSERGEIDSYIENTRHSDGI